MTAVEALTLHYDDRSHAARAWRASGGRVVGYVGGDCPVELALAAGLLPLRLWGDALAETSLADRYSPELEPVTRSILQRLLDGGLEFLDLLVIDHSAEAHATLFASLREIQRVEPVASLPKFEFFDLAHLHRAASRRYNLHRIDELRRRLETLAGTAVTAERLGHARALRARQRVLLGRVAALRALRPAGLSGTDALRTIGAGMVMPPAEHCALLELLLADPPGAAWPDRPRLFVTGSSQDHPAYYQMVEAEGSVIVGEDHDWSDRAWSEVLISRASSIAEQAASVVERAVRAQADAVVAILIEGDAAAPWLIPELRRQLEAARLPLLSLADLPYAAVSSAARVSGEVSAFLSRLPGSPKGHGSR